jgi:hypothetical protein
MNKKENTKKQFNFLANLSFGISFALLAIGFILPCSNAIAQTEGSYKFDSHKGFSPSATVGEYESVIDNSGQIYYSAQSLKSRKVCKILKNNTESCKEISAQTKDLPPQVSFPGKTLLDNKGNIFLTYFGGASTNIIFLVELRTSDFSLVGKWLYTGDYAKNPGYPVHNGFDFAYIENNRIYYGLLSSAADNPNSAGNTGPFYLMSKSISDGANDVKYSKLNCPLGANKCSQMIVYRADAAVLPNGNHILSLVYDDGSSAPKNWIMVLDGDKILSDQIVPLIKNNRNVSRIKLNSENQLVVEDNSNDIYYFNILDGAKLNLAKHITMPLATLDRLFADKDGNTIISGKKFSTDSSDLVYKIDKDYNIQQINLPAEYRAINFFTLPDKSTYFTATGPEFEKTDLLKLSSGNNAEYINSFDFLQIVQTNVLYSKEIGARNPDVYVFSHDPRGGDFNDYSLLKFN